jgi:hypothetical protein
MAQMTGEPIDQRRTLPDLDIKTGHNHSPHVVILGAGASRACCPNGDRKGKKLPLMADFIEILGLKGVIEKSGEDPNDNFESIYSRLHRAKATAALKKIRGATRSYFNQLALPDHPTLYDYLILGLRKKDIIVTFNWDPLLPQAYRRWRHLGDVLPQIVFLHGNVDIGVDRDKKVSGFLSDIFPERNLVPTELLYPVDQKNYNADPFVAHQWELATWHLQHAYYITIFGYSAPITDVEARALLLTAWRSNTTKTFSQLEIIDIRNKGDVEKSWSDFLENIHGGVTPSFEHNIIMRHPRRSCESFAFATLQQDPWHENPVPNTRDLNELDEWIRVLITEEKTGTLSDVMRNKR